MDYKITLNEKQLMAINTALEEYFRLRMRQAWGLAEDLAFRGFDRENHTSEDYDARLERRFAAENLIRVAIKVADGGADISDIGDTARICEDVWQVIRHQIWLDAPKRNEWSVASREPRPVSSEPLAKIERADYACD